MLLAASLPFPALYIEAFHPADSAYPGWLLFFFGWVRVFSILDGNVDGLGWLANVTLFLGVVILLLRRYGVATICGGIGFGLAMTSFLMREVWVDEAGHTANIIGYGVGFYLWMTAVLFSFVASAVLHTVSLYARDGASSERRSRIRKPA